MCRGWSGSSDYHSLITSYVNQTTTHGIRRISSSRHPGRRVFWISIFLISFGGCCYHCSYLISTYVSNPKVTITEEKDADAVEFPSITICNLNVIKRDFADLYFDMMSNPKPHARKKFNCYGSEQELLSESGIDLSDTWLNLGVTKDNLSRYGHQANDLIIQCTYNSKNCFAAKKFYTMVTNVTSPLFGLCHTISIRDKNSNKPITLKKGGTTNGIRLTLNIEREKYWDLISSEYGVRILVHPQGTYPTLQRGGIIVSPGRSVHIGVKRRVSSLLPGWEGTCSESFQHSKLSQKLNELGLDFDISGNKYTYEHCNTLCQNAMLFTSCNCLDEQPRSASKTKWRFCNPCNRTEADCRAEILRNFSDTGNICDDICKPACNSIRYEISLSKSDWPNFNHQQFVMNRSREQWKNIPEALGLLSLSFDEENVTEFVNDTFFSESPEIIQTNDLNEKMKEMMLHLLKAHDNENLLRVHLFVEEMIYMSIQERYGYTLPKLLADLGGCLGLYLGVSVISIIEIIELCGGSAILCMCRLTKSSKKNVSRFNQIHSGSKRRRRNKTRNSIRDPYSSSFGSSLGFSKRKNKRSDTSAWRPPFGVDRYTQDNVSSRSNFIRRF